MIFLIEYDRSRGELASIEVFDDADRPKAENERLLREVKLHHKGVSREIVLLQAASEEALKETHRRYFEAIGTLADADSHGMAN